jgi:phenylacetate-CoA ligase
VILAPDVETRPWAEQLAVDDAPYRTQLAYLFERSAFYRDKLAAAGFPSPQSAGGLADIAQLPLTEKDELRATRTPADPIGAHRCAAPSEIVRIYSTSGTTGTPSYIPLTAGDLENWVTGSARSYAASGIAPGQRIVSTYNAGPFAAGAALAAFERIGLCHVPVGTGSTERMVRAIELLRPDAAVLTPSYAAHLVEWAAEHGVDLRGSSVERVLVAGEPGGGEPAFRSELEDGWGARVTEAMGIGDVGVSLWGECEEQDGMHLGARGIVHAELIDPATGAAVELDDGARGELVLTHLRHRGAPLLRFRTRDHVHVRMTPCGCGRTGPRVRCVGRTDDMLIVRGVNVFPAAVREVVAGFAPDVSGHILVRPPVPGVKQQPPLPVSVELARDARADAALADAIRRRLREALIVQTRVELVPWGTLQRSEYKTRLVEHEGGRTMRKLQSQGVHHITIVGADRRTSIDFWEGVLGMPFIFEQPNLDNEAESHLYFDPGDGRLITIFTNEDRVPDPDRTPTEPGCVHHLAFAVSQATFHQAVERLDEREIRHSGVKDRGFMDSIYFEDPLGLLIELASYRFEPPAGFTHADVLLESHRLRVQRGDYNIAQEHLADAIEALVARSRESLSDDRSPADPYHEQTAL